MTAYTSFARLMLDTLNGVTPPGQVFAWLGVLQCLGIVLIMLAEVFEHYLVRPTIKMRGGRLWRVLLAILAILFITPIVGAGQAWIEFFHLQAQRAVFIEGACAAGVLFLSIGLFRIYRLLKSNEPSEGPLSPELDADGSLPRVAGPLLLPFAVSGFDLWTIFLLFIFDPWTGALVFMGTGSLLGSYALSGVAARADLIFGIACVVIATIRALRVARKERDAIEHGAAAQTPGDI